MKKLSALFLFLLSQMLVLLPTAVAQNRMVSVISPEVHPDKTVTFRIWKPAAREIKVNAQFLKDQKVMAKDSNGVWSITLGPVTPDIYPYSFFVDGIEIMDPNNSLYFPNEHFKSSLVDIPGDKPLVHSLQNVPHGTVSYRYYNSKTLHTTQQLVIYTPPGYENNPSKKLPVLYLIHGMTDTEETWYKAGHANLILDNLLAQQKAVPMIIVMPYANIYPSLNPTTITTRETALKTDIFEKEMLEDIIPFVESNYPVIADPEHRAIAGFSLGGRQTLAIGLAHPELFGWVCAYSPAIWKNEMENSFQQQYAAPEKLRKLKLLSLSCGTEDFLYASACDFTDALKAKNIPFKTFFPAGGHTWMNCKLFLTESAQLLFK